MQINNENVAYTVEYIFGKKTTKDHPLYAVKWEGYAKSEMTWEPSSSFSTEASILRFERCFSYKFYHSKVHQRKANTNVRVHILRQYYQVHTQYTGKRPPNHPNDSQSDQDIKDVVEQDPQDQDFFYLKRGRGRPRTVDKQREMQALMIDRPAMQMEVLKKQQLHNQVNPYQPQSTYQNQIHFQNHNILSKYKIKTERDYLNEIIQNSKCKEQAQQNIKRDYQSEVDQQQQESQKKIKESGILRNQGIQYQIQGNDISLKLYDQSFMPTIIDYKILFELILSHHLIHNKLVFKCQSEENQVFYAEFMVLQQYCPTLLLDYMTINSILL